MTVSPRNELSYLGVVAANPPDFITLNRAPNAGDYQFKVGTLCVDTVGLASYQLQNVLGTVGTWAVLGGGGADVNTINGQAPIAGNYTLAGTANQITATNTAGTTTFSIPVAFTAPGSIASTTTLTGGTGITATTGNIVASTGNITSTLGSMSAATTVTAGTGITATTGNITASTGNLVSTLGSVSAATTVTAGTGITATTGNIVASTGNITSTLGSVAAATTVTGGTGVTATTGAITATNGNLVLGTAGNKIVSTSVATTIAAGANSFGKVTLVGGTATVSTTAVTANSQIMLTRQTVGATGAAALGELSIGVIVGGTSFVINAWSQADATALAATDVSSIGWMIIN